MPEVRFEDIMTVYIGGNKKSSYIGKFEIDENFVKVCEPDSIIVTGAVSSKPIQVGVDVSENKIFVEAFGDCLIENEVKLIIRLSGIRLGVTGRFFNHTYDEMIKNNNFWDSWR